LGTIIGAYKSTVTRILNGLRRTPGAPVWQRNYYEHIIRNETEFNHIWDYIDDNPQSWAEDQLHPNAVPNHFTKE
jgi:REP element-mobilizing transposase RayT